MADVHGDLWTAGLWTNLVSHISAPTTAAAAQLLPAIDVTPYVRTAVCGADAGNPHAGCGAASSMVFDRVGNLYVGTVDGTNNILMFGASGTLLDSFEVPVGARGTKWIDLAADQQTMFYMSEDNVVRIFRLDRQPLPAALFQAGVEHLQDAALDPDDVGLFGKIVVKDVNGTALTGTKMNRVRILPPGDGSGGLVVADDTYAARIDLTGLTLQNYGDVYPLSAFDLAPDGKSVWLMSDPNGDWSQPSRLSKWHMPTDTAVVDPLTGSDWSAVGALCVKDSYMAAVVQPDCITDPSNSLCQSLPICPADSPDCIPPSAPQLTQPADRTNNEGDTITPFTISAVDPLGRPLTYVVDFLPQGLTFDPVTHVVSGTIGWQASGASGLPYETPRIIVVNDRNLSVVRTFQWTIVNQDAPPSVTVSPTLTQDGNGAYILSTPRGVPISTLTLSGNDPDACDSVHFYVHSGSALPADLTLAAADVSNPACSNGFTFPAFITGTPTTDGTTTFTVESDSVSPLATFAWTVANVAPTLAPISSHQASTNTPFELAVSAADANGDALIFGATSLPSGLMIDTATGVMSGTPVTSGTSTVTVTVNDGDGGSASQSFDLSVGGLSNPAITSVSPNGGVPGTAVTVSGSGFGAAQGLSTLWIGTTAGDVSAWSDTQIVATVANGARSGTVFVQQAAMSSNAVPFTVPTPTITGVTPPTGPVGTSVTISGTAFGANRGAGSVWFGGATASVTSWSDVVIVAIVPPDADSDNLSVLQNGILSDSVPFAVTGGAPKLTSVSPNVGDSGDVVILDGSGFGDTQGSGAVTLGNTTASITSWNDTEVIATVPTGAVSGVAKVEREGLWSNVLVFRVPSSSDNGLTLVPSIVNMLSDESQQFQLLDSNGARVTGLTWASSDASVASLSSDDPPMLTALGPGTVTLTAGGASANVTIYGGASLPIGMARWANTVGDSGITAILMATPSDDGGPEAFATHGDGTVQALRTDGTVMWTAAPQPQAPNAFAPSFTPNFQGGLTVYDGQSIYSLDALTGHASTAYVQTSYEAQQVGLAAPAIHPDGTILTIQTTCSSANCPDSTDTFDGAFVVGLNSAGEKFRVPTANSTGQSDVSDEDAAFCQQINPGHDAWSYHPQPEWKMIAGDGYAYYTYNTTDSTGTIHQASSQAYANATLDLADQFLLGTNLNNYQLDLDNLQALEDALPQGDAARSFFSSQTLRDQILAGNQVARSNLANVVIRRFQRLCETSGTSTTKLHVLRVSSSGASSDIVIAEWPESHSETLSPNLNADLGDYNYTRVRSQTGPASVQIGPPKAITNKAQGALFSWSVLRECLESPEQTDPCDGTKAEMHLTTTAGDVKASDRKWTQNGLTELVEPVLQLQDGSFVGAADGQMIGFGGAKEWVATGDPVLATYGDHGSGGFVARVGARYTAFDASGAAKGPVRNPTNVSWQGNGYEVSDSQFQQMEFPWVAPAAPMYWSFRGGNLSHNGVSPICRDDRDLLIAEVSDKDSGFTPLCSSASFKPSSVTNPALHFTFAELNGSNIQRNEFPNWAILQRVMLEGLENLRANYNNQSLVISSGYRTPETHAIISLLNNPTNPEKDRRDGHTEGLAVDIDNSSRDSGRWQQLHDAGRDAKACVEPITGGVQHVHVDWRAPCPATFTP